MQSLVYGQEDPIISCTNQDLFESERDWDKEKNHVLFSTLPRHRIPVKSRQDSLWPILENSDVVIACNSTIKNKHILWLLIPYPAHVISFNFYSTKLTWNKNEFPAILSIILKIVTFADNVLWPSWTFKQICRLAPQVCKTQYIPGDSIKKNSFLFISVLNMCYIEKDAIWHAYKSPDFHEQMAPWLKRDIY